MTELVEFVCIAPDHTTQALDPDRQQANGRLFGLRWAIRTVVSGTTWKSGFRPLPSMRHTRRAGTDARPVRIRNGPRRQHVGIRQSSPGLCRTARRRDLLGASHTTTERPKESCLRAAEQSPECGECPRGKRRASARTSNANAGALRSRAAGGTPSELSETRPGGARGRRLADVARSQIHSRREPEDQEQRDPRQREEANHQRLRPVHAQNGSFKSAMFRTQLFPPGRFSDPGDWHRPAPFPLPTSPDEPLMKEVYAFGTNLREIEFTQCRRFLAVSRSPTKT